MTDEIYGPPQDNPWERLTDEQRARLDKALAIADGVKLYHAAGGAGVATQWAPYAQSLAQRGGLDPQEALTLARYRMFKQGMQPPLGPREADLTPEQIASRRDEFVAGDAKKRSQLMEEDKAAITRGHQAYFDSLVQKPKEEIVDETKPPKKVADAE